VSRVAVIGTGRWGRRLIRVLGDLGVLELACNRGNVEGQAWVRSAYPSVRVSSSAADAIDDPSIDCVVVATSIPTHASLAVAALAAGKHVFVEKPLAMTSADAWRVVEAADRADRRLFVGHTFLYDTGFERLHGLLADNPVRKASFVWLKYGTFDEPLIWNLLPHEVSLTMWLIGQPETIDIVELEAGPTELDRLRLRLGFEDPDQASLIEIDRISASRTKTAQIATRSGAAYMWRDGDLLDDRPDRGDRRPAAVAEETLAREMRAFLASVETGDAARSDGRFGARVVEVVERIGRLLPPIDKAQLRAGVSE
jgi:predicted dehydrogenase